MGKINRCLRFTFIALNSLFVIAGCALLILVMVVSFSTPIEGGAIAMLQFWLLSFGIIGLASLGVYGGVSEKRIPLIVFATLVGIAAVITFGRGIQAAVVIAQVKNHLRDRSDIYGAMDTTFKVILGLFFGTGSVALVGMFMAILMVHQIRRREDTLETFVPMRTTCGDGRHV